MTMRNAGIAALVAACAAIAFAMPVHAQAVVIENVTVINTLAESVEHARLVDRTIVVEEGAIRTVAPAGEARVPEGASRIDGRGRYVIPGLWDMHVHLTRFGRLLDGSPELMLANGVTGVRNMRSDVWPGVSGVTIEDMRALQRQINAGEVVGPRLISLAGVTVRGPRRDMDYPPVRPEFWQPRTREQGRELARFLDESGADFIKIYSSVPREGFVGMMEEANELGMPVAGHLPWAVDPIEAANMGMRSIEHARFPAYACTAHWEPFRRAFDRFAAMETDEWPQDFFHQANVRAVEDFDPALAEAIFQAFVENDVYLCPTHVTREMDARAADPEFRNDPRRRYISALVLARWDRDLDATANEGEEARARYRAFFEHGLRVTGMAHDAGVRIMAGTDANDTHSFPGFSLHDELELLVRAGLTPLEALRSGTVISAEFLDLGERYGEVSAGKAADLVLLDADPLVDIANTRTIQGVMLGGRWFDRSALDELLSDVAERMRTD